MGNTIGQAGGTKPLPTRSDTVTGGGPLPGPAPAEQPSPAPQQPLPGAADPATDPAAAGAEAVQGGGPLEMLTGITKNPWTGVVMAAIGAGLFLKFKPKTEIVNNAVQLNKGKPALMWGGVTTMASGAYLFGTKGQGVPGATPGTTTPGATAGTHSETGETVPNDAKLAYEQGIAYGATQIEAKVKEAIANGQLTDNTAGGATPTGSAPGANGSLTDNLPGATSGQPAPTDPAAQAPQGPVDPTTGQPAPTVDPTTGQPTPTIDPSTGQPVTPGTTSTGMATAIPPAQWTPTAVIGQAVQMPEGRGTTGAVIAEAGNYILQAQKGDPAGYATFEEANAAARSGMSTTLPGTKNFRWLVLEHGGRFYAYEAKWDDAKASPAPVMPPENGTVSGWNALRYVDETWTSYQYRTGAQPVSAPFADGQAVASSTSTTAGGTAPGATPAPGAQPTSPVPGQQAQPTPTTGGGAVTPTPTPGTATTTPTAPGGTVTTPQAPVPAAPVKPVSPVAGLVGKGFAINASTLDGKSVDGGYLQVQAVPELGQGVATPAEAAKVARDLKLGTLQPTKWQRWVTVRASDGKYYVLQGSIVNKPVPAMDGGAAPMHVFGHGFAQHYDGKSWKPSLDGA